jgi:hypothetical protein
MGNAGAEGPGPVVETAIVNHNTSLFAELALRSLVASVASEDGQCDLRITIVDNHSDDDVAPLITAADDLGADFALSRWPAAEAAFNTHGDVLRDFVLARPEADFYLLVDSDIDFESDRAMQTMLGELDSDGRLWAVQARFSSAEAREHGASLDIWAGRPFEATLGDWIWDEDSRVPVRGTIHPRCHPGATLVRNSELFQGLAHRVGFSSAVVIAGDPAVGGFFDTFGLTSAAMAAAGHRYDLSDVRCHHFFMASYDKVHVVAREWDCRRRLERFGRA